MFRSKIPSFLALVLCAMSALATYMFTKNYVENKTANIPAIPDSIHDNCNFKIVRLNGYEYISPLMFTERSCPSVKLNVVQQELERVIDKYKKSGVIETASVYLRHLNDGEWININESEMYNPGSLMKVPELITFMKMNEKEPGLLSKRIKYEKQLILPKTAVFVSKSIVPGNTYTIKELLYYMIAYSDNNATMLLNSIMDVAVFKKTFTDLGIPEPNLTKKDLPLTARNFSLFMRAVYNASYLSISDSEFCAELMSHSDFSDGLVSGLPKDIKVVHKFGEAGDKDFAHFSESGIIYTKNATYLLTVMTKGKQLKDLPEVVKEISGHTYNMLHIIES